MRGKLFSISDKEAPLEILGDKKLEHLQRGCDEEQRQHHQSQGNHWPEQDTERNGVHQRLNCRRSSDGEQPYAKGKNENHPHVTGIKIQCALEA